MKEQRAKIVIEALKARGMSKYMLRAKSGLSMPIINKIVRAESYHMTSFDRVVKVLGIEVAFTLKK